MRYQRPMRIFGKLIKDIMFPQKATHGWCRYPLTAKDQKQKDIYLSIIVEELNQKIKIDEESNIYR